MHNGSTDPLLILIDMQRDQNKVLHQVSHDMGQVKQQLLSGHEFHRDTAATQRLHGEAIYALTLRTSQLEKTRNKPAKPESSMKEWTELLKAFWPYLFLMAALGGMVFPTIAEVVQRLPGSLIAK